MSDQKNPPYCYVVSFSCWGIQGSEIDTCVDEASRGERVMQGVAETPLRSGPEMDQKTKTPTG